MTKLAELPPFDHQPQPYRGPAAEVVLRLRRHFLNPGLFVYYGRPLMIMEGKAQYGSTSTDVDILMRLAPSELFRVGFHRLKFSINTRKSAH